MRARDQFRIIFIPPDVGTCAAQISSLMRATMQYQTGFLKYWRDHIICCATSVCNTELHFDTKP